LQSRQTSQEETELAVAGAARPATLPPFASAATEEISPPALPSPHTAVDILTRDLERSLLLSPAHPVGFYAPQ